MSPNCRFEPCPGPDVLASTTLTRIAGDCEQPLERLHNHAAVSKDEVARATEERSSLKPAANQPGEVFNIKSEAISRRAVGQDSLRVVGDEFSFGPHEVDVTRMIDGVAR